MDEPALYDYALPPSRITAHYEAAKLNLPMRATMTVRASLTLNTDQDAAPMGLFLRHNWLEPFVERIGWMSDSLRALTDYEQRLRVRQTPTREFEAAAITRNAAARQRLHSTLFAAMGKRVITPFMPDKIIIETPIIGGTYILPIDTVGRDYDVGAYLMVWNDDGQGEAVEITAMTTTELTLSPPITATWPAGAHVAPGRVGFLDDEISIIKHSADVEGVPLQVTLMGDDTAVAPNRLGTYTPTYTHDGHPIFDPWAFGANDYSEPVRCEVSVGVDVIGNAAGLHFRDMRDTAPVETTTYNLILHGRTVIADFLAWWYSVAGLLTPIFVPSMQRDFTPLSYTSTSMTAVDTNARENYNLHPARGHVAFIRTNRTMSVYPIAGVTLSGSNEVIDFGMTINSANVLMVCFLRYCRLESDLLELAWIKDDLVRVSLRFRDLLTAP